MVLSSLLTMTGRLTRSRMKEMSSSIASPLLIGPANPISCPVSTKAGEAAQKLDVVKPEPEQFDITSGCEMSSLDSKARKRDNSHVKIEYEKPEPCVDKKCDSTEEEKSPAAKKEKWQPPLWKQQLLNIYEMRRRRDAPVDTMGCDRISDDKAEPRVSRTSSTLSRALHAHLSRKAPNFTIFNTSFFLSILEKRKVSFTLK